MTAPRVLISIGPSMYAEALAFSVRKHRPRAEVSLLDRAEEELILGLGHAQGGAQGGG